MRWIQKSHWFCSIRSSFWAMATIFTFLFTCTHVWNILEVGGGKMPCQIIVLIRNDYFNDKKYSGPIVLGMMSKRDQFEVIKPCFCACGIVGTVLSIKWRTGLCRRNWCLAKNDPLVNRDRILFPPLYIKFGLIKQFTKALDKDGDCFTYLCKAFPEVTTEKLKAGILTVFRSGSSSEIQNSKTQWTKCNWKHGRHLFW